MAHLRRMLVFVVGCFATACLSVKRVPAQLSETTSVEGVQNYSVGALLTRGDRESIFFGQGTIIAETTEQYVGITSLKALEECLPPADEATACWIRFNDAQGRPKYARVDQYSGEAKYPVAWRNFAYDQPVTFALFGINKRRAAHLLKPVGISSGVWPQEAVPVMLGVYDGLTPNGSDAKLQYVMASGWKSESEMLSASASGARESEGAPLFVYVPSRTDYRMIWRLAGIVGRHESDVLYRARSIANLEAIKARHPELAIWRLVDWDEKSAPGASGKVDVQLLEVESNAEKAHFKVVVKQADFNQKLFSVLSFPLLNQENLRVSAEGDLLTIEFDAEKTLREKFQRLAWVYFEYFDADEKPLFSACIPKAEGSKEYECGKAPPA